ncbi:MAG: NAD(P)-dependent oxidoreductase [Thermoleophilia bacterium]|nr:NAD(P)-dependent oxidoreductase [Thermoleophilia bacterium]
MNILITGAAGNLGSHLSRHLIALNQTTNNPHQLKLLIHRHELPADIASAPNITINKADLANPDTLEEPCRNTDCIVHFAGVLFAPRPEKFLPETNTHFASNLMDAALAAGVSKFIIVSFPHVEGESTPEHPAKGTLDGYPASVHAQTRLAAEKYLFNACRGTQMTPIALRPGMIYARGILMPDAARWASRHRLLAVWKKPTWIHLLSLPDFLAATTAAIEKPEASGIYNLGDDGPLTLQDFLDRAAVERWGSSWPWRRGHRPWRAPAPAFYVAGALTEAFAAVFRTRAPLTRDFIRIGMASYTADTSRMKAELLPELQYPTLDDGIELL